MSGKAVWDSGQTIYDVRGRCRVIGKVSMYMSYTASFHHSGEMNNLGED